MSLTSVFVCVFSLSHKLCLVIWYLDVGRVFSRFKHFLVTYVSLWNVWYLTEEELRISIQRISKNPRNFGELYLFCFRSLVVVISVLSWNLHYGEIVKVLGRCIAGRGFGGTIGFLHSKIAPLASKKPRAAWISTKKTFIQREVSFQATALQNDCLPWTESII